MTNIPSEFKYTKTHEWAYRDEDEDFITVGVTHHAQQRLGDIVFIELPEVGIRVHEGEEFGVIESVKAASDLYCPISGQVIAVNSALNANPALINQHPFDAGWLIKLKPDDIADLDELLDADDYAAAVEEEDSD